MHDTDADMNAPHDHPVLAALAGCLVLVGAALLVPHVLAPQPQATLLIAGAGAGAVLWLIGLIVTIRYSPMRWKLGSLAILLAAGAIAGVLAHRQYETGTRADASSFAEIEFAADGAPTPPADAAARGPVSRLYVAAVQADSRERRAFGSAMGRLGLGNLTSPYLLQQDPRALADCDAIVALKSMAREHGALRAKRRVELAQALASANMSEQAKHGITKLAGLDAAGEDALLANQVAMLDATGELCRLLARRGWVNEGGYFGFNNGGDRERFGALVKRRQQLASEAETIKRAAVARIKQGQESVREALS